MGTEPSNPAKLSGLTRVVGAVSTALVFAALAGAALWGHHTGWRFGAGQPRFANTALASPEVGLATVRLEPTDSDGSSPLHGRRVRIEFESPQAVDAIGIDIAAAWESAVIESVEAAGEVGFDPARVARVSPRASGTVWRVLKAVGDPVRSGDLLALVDAAEVGRLKAELLQAASQTRTRRQAREDLLAAGSAISEPQRREADAAVRDAEARLLGAEQALANLGLRVRAVDLPALPLNEVVRRTRLLGVSERVPGLDPDNAPATLLPIRAPLDGVVLAADAVAGEMAPPNRPLFTVADPRWVWVTLHVRPDDAARVAVGQPVRFRPDGAGEEFAGTVNWVGTAADETARTVPVRAELANADGRLRASTLGRGRVVLRERANAVVVSPAAVRSFRGKSVVFVRDPAFLKPGGPKAFYPRVVRTGAADAYQVEVVAGLNVGEVVATAGSDVLLGELQRAAAGGGQ